MNKFFTCLVLWVVLGILAACAPAPTPAPPPVAPKPTEAPKPTAVPTPAPEPTQAAAPVKIELWGGWTGADAEVIKGIIKEWNDKNPDIQVNLTLQQWSPLFDAFLVASNAKKAPDILAMHPQEMAQFVDKGLLLPLDDLVKGTAINPDNYPANVWEYHKIGGKLYGVPLDFHMHALYYNVDLVKKAGVVIPGEAMKADEFLRIARALTLDKNGKHPGEAGFDPTNIVQYAVNMHTNHHAFFQWWGLYNQLEGKFLSDDGKKCVIDIEKGARAWQWLQDLVYKEYVAPQGQTDYTRDFLSGRTAMLISGGWERPGLVNATKEKGFNWAVAPYPKIFVNQAMWGSAHNFTIPTYSDPAKRAASVKVMASIASSAGWAATGHVPVFKGMADTPQFKSLPGYNVFAEQVRYEKIFPNTTKYNEIFGTSSPTPMMVLAQNIILKKADPRTELQKACDNITAILSQP